MMRLRLWLLERRALSEHWAELLKRIATLKEELEKEKGRSSWYYRLVDSRDEKLKAAHAAQVLAEEENARLYGIITQLRMDRKDAELQAVASGARQ